MASSFWLCYAGLKQTKLKYDIALNEHIVYTAKLSLNARILKRCSYIFITLVSGTYSGWLYAQRL